MATIDYVYNVPDPSGGYYSGPVSGAPAGSVGSISLSSTPHIKDSSGNWIPSTPIEYPTSYFSGSTPLRSSSETISSESLAGGQSAISLPSAGGSTGTGGTASTGGTILGNNAGLDNLLTQAGYTKNKDGTYAIKAPEPDTQQTDLSSTIQSLFNNIPEKSSVLGSQEVQ